MKKKETHSRAAAAITALLIASAFISTFFITEKRDWNSCHIRCAIELGHYDDTTRGLLTGYNYHLLKKFAEDKGSTVTILHSFNRESSYLDSLKRENIDLIAIPYADSVMLDSVLVSNPVDSISLWILPGKDKKRIGELNKWLADYHNGESFSATRKKFLHTYDPIKKAGWGRKSSCISPYDSIFRNYSDSSGFDWRLLAAVAYQESHFRIDVRSRRGATGMMQMMPSTAASLGVSDLFDPEQGIRAGTLYLKQLYGRYLHTAASPEERIKFTLAAYNAGAGRIRDCISYASLKGRFNGNWNDVTGIIPELNDDSILQVDTVKLGKFKGVETTAYVDRVLSLYEAFRTICP